MFPIKPLPTIIPLFPLSGVILLPGKELPLNIFEPRYLAMVRDALAGDQMIGMVQPHPEGEQRLYSVGGAGRIMEHAQTPDGRIELVLTGVSRFGVLEETDSKNGYRRARVDWGTFPEDQQPDASASDIDSKAVVQMMERFFAAQNLEVEWQGRLDQITGAELVDGLARTLPFPPEAMQA